MKKHTYDLARFILSEERKHPNATGSLSYALNSISTAAKIISSKVRRAGTRRNNWETWNH